MIFCNGIVYREFRSKTSFWAVSNVVKSTKKLSTTYVDLSMAEDIKLSLGGLIGGELLGEGTYVAFLAFLYSFNMLTMCVSPIWLASSSGVPSSPSAVKSTPFSTRNSARSKFLARIAKWRTLSPDLNALLISLAMRYISYCTYSVLMCKSAPSAKSALTVLSGACRHASWIGA